VTRLHHVNLGVRPDDVGAEIDFVVDVLGYRRLEVQDDSGMTRRWFEADDGTQIHLSEDEDHRPAGKAHVALVVDDLDALTRRLIEREWKHAATEFPGGPAVVLCKDPAGNRFELRAAE
jgi:catechol 2,3-dioxygenase-like lactoylglutathione lyase family enzyme